MKKIFILILVNTMLFVLCSCNSNNISENDLQNDNIVNNELEQNNKGMEDGENGNQEGQEDKTDSSDESTENQNNGQNTETKDIVKIDEQVLYDENGIKITAISLDLESSFMGPSLKLLLENNSENDATVQIRNLSINDIMAYGIFSSDITVGKKSYDSIDFSSSQLEKQNIKDIAKIEFDFHIFDSTTWNTIADSDTITIKTSLFSENIQSNEIDGTLIYDSNNIKVFVLNNENESNTIWGSELPLYIENNTGNNITIQTRDVSVNGFMMDPVFSCDIATGKKAFDSITFMDTQLKESNIDKIAAAFFA